MTQETISHGEAFFSLARQAEHLGCYAPHLGNSWFLVDADGRQIKPTVPKPTTEEIEAERARLQAIADANAYKGRIRESIEQIEPDRREQAVRLQVAALSAAAGVPLVPEFEALQTAVAAAVQANRPGGTQ